METSLKKYHCFSGVLNHKTTITANEIKNGQTEIKTFRIYLLY